MGLFGEVVENDIYQMRQLDFAPDVIFDLGANVGVFTRFAQSLFPEALIVCVEPDNDNSFVFHRYTPDNKRIVFYLAAIGTPGPVWKAKNATNGAHETYFPQGMDGYPDGELQAAADYELAEGTVSVMPDMLLPMFCRSHQKGMVKCDIEGAETAIFDSPSSMAELKKMEYLVFEMHNHALHAGVIGSVRRKTLDAMHYFEDTHYTKYEHPIFYARKRKV